MSVWLGIHTSLDLLPDMPHWSRKLHMLLGLSMWQGLLVPQFGKLDNRQDKHSGPHKAWTSLGSGSLYLPERKAYQDRIDLPAVT